jgi:uncharacterized membrane protein YqgA involved in biofilm formation
LLQRELYGAAAAKEIFFVSIAGGARHNRDVIGAFLNALGILLGALFGLVRRRPLALRPQKFLQSALGAFVVLFGLRLVLENLGGTWAAGLKSLLIAALAILLGFLLGRLLGLQKISNRLGHQAAGRIAAAQQAPPGPPVPGLLAVSVLFCAAPLGLVGAVTDGLGGYYFPLALKAVMDGLAMAGFVKLFRWPVALAALPVGLFLNGLTLAAQAGARLWLVSPALVASVNLTAGLILCAMALVILGLRRVELANYLPALAVAPLLTWLLT